MDARRRLQANNEMILNEYNDNLDSVLNLQSILIRDILPSVTDELQLGPDATEWAKKWLDDTCSIFRIFRRNKYTRSFALESIRKTLFWRLSKLWPLMPTSSMLNVHCLPSRVRDPFGRPMLVIEVNSLNEDPEVFKEFIIQGYERFRIHIKNLYDRTTPGNNPPLQYIILLNLKALSLQSINIDLITWTVREVIPHFPGLVGGVFIINYSWAHSGMWNIVKRLLPETALSRVFFPANNDLLDYFTPSALPKDFGGSLPYLKHLEDPLQVDTFSAEMIHEEMVDPSSPSPSYGSSVSPIFLLSSTSLLNPFYGYPASTSSPRGSLSLYHGRRRKRDLLRTLALLFWMRWHTHVTFGIALTVVVLAYKTGYRILPSGFVRRISSWRYGKF